MFPLEENGYPNSFGFGMSTVGVQCSNLGAFEDRKLWTEKIKTDPRVPNVCLYPNQMVYGISDLATSSWFRQEALVLYSRWRGELGAFCTAYGVKSIKQKTAEIVDGKNT